MSRRAVIVSWSTGKDAAWALHQLQQLHGEFGIAGLVTTFRESDGLIGIHEVPLARAREHAARLGLPLHEIPLPADCPNEVYAARMSAFARAARREGVDTLAFGDLYLEDIRAYRESIFASTGLRVAFPLWGRDTTALAREMIASGLEARIIAVDHTKLPRALVGRTLDVELLEGLPDGVDWCGERGEFHTLVVNGPMFRASG